MLCGALAYFAAPASALAGTFTGGATFPEQIVHETTSLMSYAKEMTTAMASVQNEINTLNSYETDLQNLMSMPAQELSKITTPIQQMEYNYNEVMNLESEYRQMYGSLSNIKSTVEQQNLDILNSSLSPQNYLNTVESANTQVAAQTRAQIQQAAQSMQNVDRLTPQIEAQSQAIGKIDGNTSGQMEMANELNTIEQQNQILLQDISSSELAANNRRNLREEERSTINYNNSAIYQSDVNAESAASQGLSAIPSQIKSGESSMKTYNQCLENGGNFVSCDKNGAQIQ